MAERRQYERYKVDFRVKVEYTRGSEWIVEETNLSDLSASGALLPVSSKVQPGEEVVINITTPRNVAGEVLGLNRTDFGGDLVFKCAAKVLRLEERGKGKSRSNVAAVEFSGPLRITGITRNKE